MDIPHESYLVMFWNIIGNQFYICFLKINKSLIPIWKDKGSYLSKQPFLYFKAVV